MPQGLTLYVCHVDDGGPGPHACRRAQRALRDAGHHFEKVVYGKGHPFGLFTKGKRPDLKVERGWSRPCGVTRTSAPSLTSSGTGPP